MSKQDIRADFRKNVFTRDDNHCVVPFCNKPVADAHHIIERALWKDEAEQGGYLVDNGVSVCEVHHRHAEKDFIPPQALRQWARIPRRVLPKQLDASKVYTKWGIELTPPNRDLVKYPHTRYLNFTPGCDKLDVDECGYIETEKLLDKPLVITLKLDGSNVKLTSEIVTARNGHSAPHKSFDLLKARHSSFKHLIPRNISVFAEWLYAKHSIHYRGDNALNSLLQVFAVYDHDTQLWYGWLDVCAFALSLGLQTVPELGFRAYQQPWELQADAEIIGNAHIRNGHEGLVIRSWYPFHWSQFGDNVAKFVRANHVTTDKHWSRQPLVKNEVRA